MTNLSKSQTKLLSGAGRLVPAKPKSRELTTQQEFHRNLLHVDEKVAAAIEQDQAGINANQQFICDMRRFESERLRIDYEYEEAKTHYKSLKAQLRATPKTIKNNQAIGNEDQRSTPFLKWRRADQIGITFLLTSLCCALITGAANIFVALLSTGQAIFIEKPWIAVLMSMLAPTGAMAIKYSKNIFYLPQSKNRFVFCIYTLSALSLLAWSIEFSIQFSGVSNTAIDWQSLGNESEGGKGNRLVFLQIFAEILVASALALAAEDIYSKYDSDIFVINEAYKIIEDDVEKAKKEFEIVSNERGDIHGKIDKLYADHGDAINSHLAGYVSIRSRSDQANNF